VPAIEALPVAMDATAGTLLQRLGKRLFLASLAGLAHGELTILVGHR
jgi:hypothetical protein